MSTVMEERKDENLEDLDFTKALRKRVITALTIDKSGQFGLPEDVKEQGTLMKALDGIDKAALGKMRIKIEDKVANNNAEQAAMIAAMFKQVGHNSQAYMNKNPDLTNHVPPEVPAHFKPPVVVEGATAITPPQDTYESFMAQAGASLDEAPDE